MLPALILPMLLTLSACSEKTRTVSYYEKNAEAARDVLDKCKAEQDKGYEVEGVLAENCKNALKAQRKLIRDNIIY